MTTNSILKSIRIRDKKLAKRFIKALENAHEKKEKDVIVPGKVQTLDKDQVKKVFGEE